MLATKLTRKRTQHSKSSSNQMTQICMATFIEASLSLSHPTCLRFSPLGDTIQHCSTHFTAIHCGYEIKKASWMSPMTSAYAWRFADCHPVLFLMRNKLYQQHSHPEKWVKDFVHKFVIGFETLWCWSHRGCFQTTQNHIDLTQHLDSLPRISSQGHYDVSKQQTD